MRYPPAIRDLRTKPVLIHPMGLHVFSLCLVAFDQPLNFGLLSICCVNFLQFFNVELILVGRSEALFLPALHMVRLLRGDD